MIKGKFFLNKEIFVSLIIYGIISLLLLFYFGINTGGEAAKYINEANAKADAMVQEANRKAGIN